MSSKGKAKPEVVKNTLLELCAGRFLTLNELAALVNRSPVDLRQRFIKAMVDDEKFSNAAIPSNPTTNSRPTEREEHKQFRPPSFHRVAFLIDLRGGVKPCYPSAVIHEIHLQDEFDSHVSDGAKAFEFRVKSIDPYLNMPDCDGVVLDFTGIRSANSSFVNALISGLLEQHGAESLQKLVFRGCLPTIQVLVQSAVDLGIEKHNERV